MEKKTIFIISGIVLFVIVLSVVLFLIFGKGLSSGNEKRTNTIKVIKMYFDQGEYDRALKLCEDLLIQNPEDKEVLDLQEKIIAAKKDKNQLDESAKNDKDQADKQKLIDAMNQMAAEKRNEKPIIIQRNSNEQDNNNNNLNKAEKEKRDKINQLISEGIQEFNNQNYAKAKSKFLDALKLEDDNAEANAYLGTTLFNENPNDQKNITEAVNKLKKALKKDNSIAEAHFTLAKIYDKQGANDLAIEEYKETIKLNPQNYEAFAALGKIYYKQKEYEKAENQFAIAVKIKKDYVNGYYYLALTDQRLNRKNDTITNYKKAISLDPKYYAAQFNLGKLYLDDKDYTNSLTYLQNAYKIENKYQIHVSIGDAYLGLNQPDKALEEYQISIALNPKQVGDDKFIASQTYSNIADIQQSRGKFNDALESVKKGISLNDSNPSLYYISGIAKSKLNDNNGAIEDYKKSISLDSTYITAYINLSSLYNTVGQSDEAIKIAQTGISKDPSQYKLYNNLGDSYQKNSSFKEAIGAYKSSLDKNPSNPDVQFNLGVCYKATDDYESSLVAFKQAIKLNSNFYNAYYELGESYFLLKKFDEAKIILKSLIDKKPDYSRKEDINKMLSAMN